MAIKYISRVVDLDGNSVSETLPASFFDGEQTAHMFTISARRGGQPVTLSGAVSATFLNANDTVVPLDGSISNGAAVVTLSDACYEVTGRFILTISVAGAVIYECNSRIKRRQSSTIYDPTGELSPASIAQDIADVEEATAAANTAAAAAEAAAKTVAEMLEGENFSYSGVTESQYAISVGGLWTTGSTQKSYTFAIPPTVKKIKATGNANGSIIAFLDTYSPAAGNAVDFAEDYGERITLSENESKEFVVTGDMHYFFALLKDSSNTDKTPTVKLYYLETDTTLSEAHISADAKAVGDMISQEAMRLSDNIWSVQSNGELYELPITGNRPFARYRVVNGNTVASNEGDLGTDYILAPKYLVIAFALGATSARVMLYFFTKSGSTYTPRWDLLSLTTSDGIKNYLSISNSVNRVIEVPDGTYIRLSNPVKGDVKVFGWSGKHFGCEITGSRQSPTETDTDTYEGTAFSEIEEAVHVSGKTGIVIPGAARLICAKAAVFRNIWGRVGSTRTGSTYTKIISGGNLQAIRLPEGYDTFYIRLSLDASVPYNGNTPSAKDYGTTGDLGDNISALCAYHAASKPFGKAYSVISHAKQLLSIPWKCLRSTVRAAGSEDVYFKYNAEFRGVPYMSMWTKASIFGWHISARTFVNAANDSRSIFYKEAGRRGGPGYGLVCSSFASLAAGFPYPLTNYGFMNDPKCIVRKTNQPQSGMIHTDGKNHCVIPELNGYGADFEQYTLYEEVGPFTERSDNLTCTVFPASWINNWHYIDAFLYAVDHIDSRNDLENVYDVTDVTIANGTARPYRGDRCVYTSNDTILINIKDTSATTCYYQKCTYNATTKEFTLTDDPVKSVAVQTDDSYYAIIDKTTISDGFWAVWTDVGTDKEYFEYHTAPTVTYTYTPSTNFAFTVNNVSNGEFWYALWWQDDTPSEETEIVPYDENGDYSDYAKVYNPNGQQGYVFFKGALGAYVVPATLA